MFLDDGVTPISLDDSLEWIDEFDFSSIGQDVERTIGGALIISESILQKGRPITLVSGDHVWTDRSTINQLYAAINQINKTYTLTLPDARTFSVVFDHSQKPMEAKPVWRKNVQGATDKYLLTLRLMEV